MWDAAIVGTRELAVRIKINDKPRLPCSRAFAHGAGGIPLELARAGPGFVLSWAPQMMPFRRPLLKEALEAHEAHIFEGR